jgi:hypothetical protein
MRVSHLVTLTCLACLIVASFGVPVVPSASPATAAEPVAALAPALAARVVRVAVYDEPNTTRPAYATIGLLNATITPVVNLLTAAGCQVTTLTTAQIANHALLTASYDVLVLVDNLPRESIVNQVKEFWLGGGGVLSMDSAISFLCYGGLIPPESEGNENYGVYWTYASGFFATDNVTARHPATKAFHINDTVTTTSMDWAQFYWAAISASSVGSDLTCLATRAGSPNRATIVALDPTVKGGRVIQLPATCRDPLTDNISAILPTAVNWLCPRPKARIAYDLSHQPRLGVDLWDDLPLGFPGFYPEMRDDLVSRGYTVDKLYPSATGNFTAARLAPYDLLIVVAPDANFTAADRSALNTWIEAGHGLLVFGETPTFPSFLGPDQRINFLLDSLDLRVNMTVGAGSGHSINHYATHPTSEACAALTFDAHGYLNITGAAYSLWSYSVGTNVVVAGQSYGRGRVIVATDINFPDTSHITQQDNEQYLINLANWLTASTATVLLYTDEPYSANKYRTPVCQALNDLNVSYALTFTAAYLNLSLSLYPWSLVIVDNPWYSITSYYNDLGRYVDAGGRLLFSSFMVDNVPSSTLWPKLGFTYAADMPNHAPLYVWSASHAIFTTPNAYHPGNFTPTLDYGDEGDCLTVLPNATALAGNTTTVTAGRAVIVLRNDKHTLYNGYLIDQFAGDLDDSTYEDRLELWENEIAFMLVPLPPLVAPLPWWLILLVVVIVLVIVLVLIVVLLRRRKKGAK